MSRPKNILIKLTGEIFSAATNQAVNSSIATQAIKQIAQLHRDYQIGIVIGGGNYFRGSIQGKSLGLQPWYAHSIGMFATVMNGLTLMDLLSQHAVPTALFSALDCPLAGNAITPEAIHTAIQKHECLIFSGGTGNPYFTTDTNAVLRALQIGAQELWKATDVDGIYDQDPHKNPRAQRINEIRYHEALEKKLGIMDFSALALAAEHQLTIRVFDISAPDALLLAARDPKFGSVIHK